jgi:hypothetical protein
MSTTIREISHMIGRLRAQHDRALQHDLAALVVRYGNVAVAEATRLIDQHALRDALSVSADRHRRHAARQANDHAQQLFVRKPHDE